MSEPQGRIKCRIKICQTIPIEEDDPIFYWAEVRDGVDGAPPTLFYSGPKTLYKKEAVADAVKFAKFKEMEPAND